jgi:glycosyltransferase involved in cell wall biosynthesis
MKIAFIYPTFTGPFGGERHVLRLSEQLAYEGHEVTIYTFKAPVDLLPEHPNVKVVEFFGQKRGGHQFKTITALMVMPLIAARLPRSYDVVVGMSWQSAFALRTLSMIGKYPKSSLAYYCLEPPRFLYDLNDEAFSSVSLLEKLALVPLFRLIRSLDAFSVNGVNIVLANGDWTAREVKKVYGKNATIVYPGIEISRFEHLSHNEARKELNILADQVIYLSVSKLHKRKRVDESISLYRRQRSRRSQYFIIGEGPEKNNLLNLTQNDKDIHFLGKLSDNEVVAYMKAANYFLFNAKNEPFGIAPLEAVLAGCEVLPSMPTYQPLDWSTTSKSFLNAIGLG